MRLVGEPFDHDTELPANLTALTRPQDLFLLEVATTDALSDDLARDTVEEYARSRAYREFATSALLRTHSDFQVPRSAQGFGVNLLLLAPDRATTPS
ncbi:hypothetical protein [Saccharothrix australiensis]|uniref:Uncharacterized protein n=1 Tax=Saccharothrix australiensis TaxID=2072 RepID=A0A495W0G0_9PSEU|nr:hypothetical protein [Saccharothrix australiensis]RKT54497.1 hypothetical protein C8E97_3140 [Saccharothrix australiensis]